MYGIACSITAQFLRHLTNLRSSPCPHLLTSFLGDCSILCKYISIKNRDPYKSPSYPHPSRHDRESHMNAHQLVQLQVINFPLMRYRFKVGGHKEYMALKSPTIGNSQPIQQLVPMSIHLRIATGGYDCYF